MSKQPAGKRNQRSRKEAGVLAENNYLSAYYIITAHCRNIIVLIN
jgi:hypothetical protein